MTVIHANDTTTSFLSLLYEQREDVLAHMTEKDTNAAVRRAIRGDDTIMMLGHGNEYGLFCPIVAADMNACWLMAPMSSSSVKRPVSASGVMPMCSPSAMVCMDCSRA